MILLIMTMLIENNEKIVSNNFLCKRKTKLNIILKIRYVFNDITSNIIIVNMKYLNKIFIKGNNIFISSKRFDKMLLNGNIFYYILLNVDDNDVIYGLETFKKYKQYFLLENDNKKIFEYIKIYLKLYSNLSLERKLILLFVFLQLLDGNSIFEIDTNLNKLEDYFNNLNISLLSQEELNNIFNYVNNKVESKKLFTIIKKLETKLFNYCDLFI